MIVEKWIFGGVLRVDGLASFLVEDVKPQIETPQQFNEPLVDERIRHKNQHTFCAAGEDQPMKDEAGFNGFAETHFIC